MAEQSTPTSDWSEVEARYREQVVRHYDSLPLSGLPERDPGLHSVPLEKVFVKLNTEIAQSGALDPTAQRERARLEQELAELEAQGGKADRRQVAELQARIQDIEREARRPQIITQSVAEALLEYRRLVVVGGPGSGKTTLTRWLALTFAQGVQGEADRLGSQFGQPRLPILLELRRFSARFAGRSEVPHLADEIAAFISGHAYYPNTPAQFVAQALAEGRCILLIDGLDEIADIDTRRVLVAAIDAFFRRPDDRYRDNLCLVTSRPYGYRDASLGGGFQTSQVKPFEAEDVRTSIGHWYETAYGDAKHEEAGELIGAVGANPRVLDLATNPLLCTIIAIVYRNNRVLPNRRVELYLKCCEALLDTWERNKDIRDSGLIGRYDWQTKLELLAPLAYWLHSETERLAAPEEQFVEQLSKVLEMQGRTAPGQAKEEARRFLGVIRERSGLLSGRGDGSLEFAHRTFQEYLAARHIAIQPYPDYIDLVMEHLHEAWWREVHLLVAGHLGSSKGGVTKASSLIQTILAQNQPPGRLVNRVSNLFPRWKLVQRISTALARDFELAAACYIACLPHGVTEQLRQLLQIHARTNLLLTVTDVCRRNDQDVIMVSCQVLRRSGWEDVLADLIGALGCNDNLIREIAATRLGQLQAPSPDAAEALVSTLTANRYLGAGSELTEVRSKGFNRGSSPFHGAVSDPEVRAAAARSLGTLGMASSGVAKALVEALAAPHELVRVAAEDSLIRLGQASPSVADALMDALSADDELTRVAAASILGRLGIARWKAIEVLIGACDFKPANQSVYPTATINIIHPPYFPADARTVVKRSTSLMAAMILGEPMFFCPEVVHALISLMDDGDWDLREAAAMSLASLGRNTPVVEDALVSVLHTMRVYGDWSVRMGAASALGMIGNVRHDAMEALIQSARDDDHLVQSEAIESLGKIGRASSDVIQVLVSALSANDWRVRSAAATSLGLLGHASQEVVNALSTRLIEDEEWIVHFRSANSLIQLGHVSPPAMDVLVDAANQRSRPSLCVLALTSLGNLPYASPEVLNALLGARDAAAPDVRYAAGRSLAQLGQKDQEVARVLINSLTASTWKVQAAAAYGLGDLGQASPDVLDALTNSLVTGDGNVRKAVATSLGTIGLASPKAVEALIAAMRHHSYKVRGAAAHSLGRIRNYDDAQLSKVLHALSLRLRGEDRDVSTNALASMRTLVQGRPIPGYKWTPLRVRRERRRRLRQAGYWLLVSFVVIAVALAATWLLADVATDSFLVRFLALLAAIVAFGGAIAQILGRAMRSPWDRE